MTVTIENILKTRENMRVKCFQQSEALKSGDWGLMVDHGIQIARLTHRLEAMIELAGGVEAVEKMTATRKPSKAELEKERLKAEILRSERRRQAKKEAARKQPKPN